MRDSYDRVADKGGRGGGRDRFAEDVGNLGPVLDVGCGPGTVTGFLSGLGVDASGVDLSPRMVEHARRLHPGLRFEVAFGDRAGAGRRLPRRGAGWWSLFNLPRDVLPGVLASFARALVPGGQLLLGTHVGDGEIARTEAYGAFRSRGPRTSGARSSSPPCWATRVWSRWPNCGSRRPRRGSGPGPARRPPSGMTLSTAVTGCGRSGSPVRACGSMGERAAWHVGHHQVTRSWVGGPCSPSRIAVPQRRQGLPRRPTPSGPGRGADLPVVFCSGGAGWPASASGRARPGPRGRRRPPTRVHGCTPRMNRVSTL